MIELGDIFKAYDIRGIYPSELNEEIIEKIGRAFAAKTKAKNIVIGSDQRTHSPSLQKALVKGLTESGVEIIDIGLSTTPMFYFAVAYLKAEAGMMVTASHNPAQYNGLKMTWQEAKPFGDAEIQELKVLVEKNQFEKIVKVGKVTKQDIYAEYKKKLLSLAQIKRALKIVVDTGNGMCGLTEPGIFRELPLQVTYLYPEIDLTYPNHEANPLKLETMKDLQSEVVRQKADLGLAFDGDGDRAGFVDEKGEIVPMDLVTALMADHLNQPVIYDVRSSKIIREVMEQKGVRAVPSRVGHYFIKKLMREKNIALGGEVSGHYYFKELSYTDSAVLAAIKVMNILSPSHQTFSELMRKYRKYAKINETNFEVKDKAKKLKEVESRYIRGQVSHLDGLTIEFPDWWFNLRESNTEPLLRLNLEADSEPLLKEKTKELTLLIAKNNKV